MDPNPRYTPGAPHPLRQDRCACSSRRPIGFIIGRHKIVQCPALNVVHSSLVPPGSLAREHRAAREAEQYDAQ